MSTTNAVRRFSARWMVLLGVIVLTSAAARGARAQAAQGEPATITGRVTSEAGTPVADALVTVRGLRLSATTNETGTYRLVVPAGRAEARTDTLVVTRIGFRPARVAFAVAPGRTTVDAVLSIQAVALEQILVTGTAGNQERRAQAAVVASIDAADVVSKAPISNVNELLTAREAGVTLTTASGTSGANTRIDIRGQASISLSNYPLVFIDGVRMTAGQRFVAQAPNGTTNGAGGQILNALNDLNPNDIESIEVVKGPAASTLYGADASAGVIQILTKKGRAGSRNFSQSVGIQYDGIDPNFTPQTNYAECSAALVAADSPNPLCRGQAPGTIVSDNPIARLGAFDDGHSGQLQYSASGGGESFGYYGSFSALDEQGTTEGSRLNHRSGRANVNWTASGKLSLEATMGVSRSNDQLPQGDQSAYGYLINGGFGSAASVTTGADGRLAGGMLNNNLSVASVSAIKTKDVSYRTTPSVQARYSPASWFSNRVTIGGDFVRTSAFQLYPRNDKGWYSTSLNTGSVAKNEIHATVYTVDYLGNIATKFGRDGWISSDLSFGTQWINTVNESLNGAGLGLLVNSNDLISAATTSSVTETYGQSKSFGLLAQEQIGFNDRLFIQLGAREDRNSAFGSKVGSFFLPKAGVSYVLSDEPFWKGLSSSFFPTLRLRAAYGETGRSPSSIAALQTYSRSNYITDAGAILPGVSPGSPGNADLKPEHGTEFEAGFDAGFLGERVGVEFTYFAKTSKDLLLTQPIAPSSGFASAPLVNIGEMTNKGVEVAVRARPIDRRNVSWDAGLNVSTLRNRIVSMGSVTPFVSNNQCFKPGVEVAAWCVQRVVSLDAAGNEATVSDTAQLAGGQLPKWSGNVNTTLTLFRNVRVYALADGKFGHKIYNLSKDFRDRAFGNSGEAVLAEGQGGYSAIERLRRFGPFVTQTTGAEVGATLVRGDYIESGDFVRFRELSVTWTLPTCLLQRVGASSSSLSVGGRNLALWKKYSGYDPEVIGVVDPNTPFFAEVFTTPQSRRVFARLNLQF